MKTRVGILVILFSLGAWAETPTPQTTSRPTSQRSPKSIAKRDARIVRLTDLLARTYSRPLMGRKASGDWLVRAVAISALARLNSPKTTAPILEALRNDRDPLVRVCAWEALAARSESLTADEYRTWVEVGVQMLCKGEGFAGPMRAGPLRAAGNVSPNAKFTTPPSELVKTLLPTLSPSNPGDKATLKAFGEMFARWKDPDLVRRVVTLLGRPATYSAAETVLAALDPAFAPSGVDGNNVTSSTVSAAKKHFHKWLRTHRKAGDPKLNPQPITSAYFPAPKIMRDPDASIWTDDMEIGRMSVDHFDLAFCIDSTGSMQPVMQQVAVDVVALIRVMLLIAREPRIGVVFYRHESQGMAQRGCCLGKKVVGSGAKTKGRDYIAKVFALTSRVSMLSKRLLKERANFGHLRGGSIMKPQGQMSGGAVYGGIAVAEKRLKWSKSKHAKKVLIVIGDTPMTIGTQAPCLTLVQEMAKERFQVHFLRCSAEPELKTEFAPLAKAGGGVNLEIRVDVKQEPAGPSRRLPRPGRSTRRKTSSPTPAQTPFSPEGNTVYQAIVQSVVESIVPEKYRTKVAPVISILLDYAQWGAPRKRNLR